VTPQVYPSPELNDAHLLIVTVAVAVFELEVAVMVADPSATEVTRPADETVATPVLDELHVTVGLKIVLSLASFTVGVIVAVSLNDEKLTLSVDSVTAAATWVTVTDAVALADPLVAVIVAVPSATDVTSPADDTVATDAADVAHVTVAPEIVAPPGSFTVAVSVAVSANEAKLRLVGETVTLAAILMLTGTELFVVVPSPSWPHGSLFPQQ
jgi:hypothetical protein